MDGNVYEIKCGDKVKYPPAFGDETVLIFVGMAPQLLYSNDCVVTHNGHACPVKYSELVKVET